MTRKLFNYVTTAKGFVAGIYFPKDAPLKLSKAAAKYENVRLVSEGETAVEPENTPETAEPAKRAPRKKPAK